MTTRSILQRLKPSPARFAAAAAVYVPDLLLELESVRYEVH